MPYTLPTLRVREDETNDDDDACVDKRSLKSSHKTTKRKSSDGATSDCPVSPVPSLDSEASSSNHHNDDVEPRRKRRKHALRRRVSFNVDEDDNLKPRFIVYDKYDDSIADDIWWSKCDLKLIMKREGRLVLNLKIAGAPTTNGGSVVPCVASSLKQSINETFKKCSDAPLDVTNDNNAPAIYEFIQDDDSSSIHAQHPGVTTTTTTRGLERYIAPIMGAHREMVVKSLLTTQGQLHEADPNFRTHVLSSRYEHMSKVAANFAVVMGQCDAKLASTNL